MRRMQQNNGRVAIGNLRLGKATEPVFVARTKIAAFANQITRHIASKAGVRLRNGKEFL